MTKKEKEKYLIPLVFVVAAALIIASLPREGQFKYQYQKGSPWMYDNLDATFDFPILKTEEELRAERERITRNFTPYFILRSDIEAEQLRAFSTEAEQANIPYEQQSKLLSLYKTIYSRGILDNTRHSELDPETGLAVIKGNIADKKAVSDVYSLTLAKNTFLNSVGEYPMDLTVFLTPNLIYDESTTYAVQSSSLQDISLTKGIVHTGQRIISKGEVVTGYSEQILNSLRAEYNTKIGFSGNILLLIIGQTLWVILALFILFILIRAIAPQMLKRIPELIFILFLFVLTVAGSSLLYKVEPSLLYLLPFPVIVLFMDSFFPTRLSLPLYLLFLVPLALITDSYQLFLINIIAGGVAVFVFKFWGSGWQQFLSALLVFVAYLVSDISLQLISEGTFQQLHVEIFRNYGIAAILMIASYPLVFLFEKIFGFVSLSRLRDLADTGNKMLRELSEKAPGTMQHSLQVANLSETAARSIGANALLCRVGSLYHDIGKINNPQYFTENQAAGFNPHTLLNPRESARIIIQHVEDGKSMAKKFGLPTLVSDFIETHHGRTRTEAFYTAWCNEGGDPDNVEDFTYEGQLPTTREHVIVMLADAVEAACRSLKDYTPESISTLVHKMIRQRISEDQLQNADITYRDLRKIQEVLNIQVQEMYHSRITYPKRKRLK
ncbi:MAG: HDIG domain-containing protein [Bacteroidales bacterium]|jgi:putative nucleotidyltransferase with HDIG domain|nr:HDIG domain-containing protein [Bacteroidales bacterium]HHV39965.1 HDIG domain-containing protein [Bacteroidales bacterium]